MKYGSRSFEPLDFDPIRLLDGALLQMLEIHLLQNWRRLPDRVQGAPEQLLSGDSESETLQRLKQAQAGIVATGEPDFRAAEFLRQPCAGVAHAAIFDAKSGHQVVQLIVIGFDVVAQLREKRGQRRARVLSIECSSNSKAPTPPA